MSLPILIAVSTLWFASSDAPCVAVDGDRILARHLAAANKDFAALDPQLELGFSPRAGIVRSIRAGELQALARRTHLALTSSVADVCFARTDQVGLLPAARRKELDVVRGEEVDVEVHSGAARIQFSAKSESAGRTGDSILVRNPENGRLFAAKVVTRRKVLVQR